MEEVLEYYRKKGYHRVIVDPQIVLDTAAAQVDVTYVIVEGPKALIAAVDIEGTKAFKAKKIARQMKNRRKKVFDEKQLTEDIKAIEDFYKNRGYLDYKLQGTSVSYNAEATSITIRISLTEGGQFRHGDTTFSGNVLYA